MTLSRLPTPPPPKPSKEEEKRKAELQSWFIDQKHPSYLGSDRISITAARKYPRKARLRDQKQSLFCSLLPQKIRLLIFEHLLVYGVVHVQLLYRESTVLPYTHPSPLRSSGKQSPATYGRCQWRCIICTAEKPSEGWYGSCCGDIVPVQRTTYQTDMSSRSTVNLALLTVCRKLHSEAFSVLYSRNAFDFERLKPPLLYLPRLWTSTHLQLLRSIRISWYMNDSDFPHRDLELRRGFGWTIAHNARLEYDKFWASFAQLLGLSVLCVALNTISVAPSLLKINLQSQLKEKMVAAWLEPINMLKDSRLGKFELVLGFSWIEAIWDRERAEGALYFSQNLSAASVLVGDEPFTLLAFDDTHMNSGLTLAKR